MLSNLCLMGVPVVKTGDDSMNALVRSTNVKNLWEGLPTILVSM